MFDVLLDRSRAVPLDVPEAVIEAYGSTIGFPASCVVANFVASLDGVAALPEAERSSAVISGGNRGDRFVMGLLRACSDIILLGAGTLRTHPASLWTPANALEDQASNFAELRNGLRLPPEPLLAIATASGKVDLRHPALARGGIVITTSEGAKRLRGRSDAAHLEVLVAGDDEEVSPEAIVQVLRDRGHSMILTEGGPTLFGHLLRARLVDELFLTISNRIAGRTHYRSRLGIVEDATFLPEVVEEAELLSVRRCDSHVLLRYAFRAGA
ncbi:MAG: dihydrofolate reductase family protein [Actinomycetota bacterium]